MTDWRAAHEGMAQASRSGPAWHGRLQAAPRHAAPNVRTDTTRHRPLPNALLARSKVSYG